MSIVEIFDTCAKTAKKAERESILLGADKDLVNTILHDVYDKNKTYGVTTKNILVNFDGKLTVDRDYHIFHDLLEKLASRELTGNAAIDTVVDTIQKFRASEQQLLLDIIDRNIAIGVSLDSWCKMAGIKQNKFEVPLAYNIEKVNKVNPIDGTFFASHKLDGVRCLAKVDVDNQEVEFFSRSGKEYKTLDGLKAPLLKILANKSGKWAVDGEVCHLLEDGSEDFQGIMKQVTRKNYTIDNPHYCIFDLVEWDVFENGDRSPIFTDRYKMIQELPTDEHIIILEQERVTSQEIYDKWYQRVIDNNWEGFMLRKDAPFKKGRSKDLLKVKPYDDAEFKVIDIVAGKQTFAVPGKGNMEFDGVKDIIIEVRPGEPVHVGGGLTKEQRIEWLANPSLIIGKTVTIKFLEETVDQNGKHSLRHPTLKYVYDGDRDV